MFGGQMCWRAQTMRVRRGGTQDFEPLQNFRMHSSPEFLLDLH